jgi:hypothetical protein
VSVASFAALLADGNQGALTGLFDLDDFQVSHSQVVYWDSRYFWGFDWQTKECLPWALYRIAGCHQHRLPAKQHNLSLGWVP